MKLIKIISLLLITFCLSNSIFAGMVTRVYLRRNVPYMLLPKYKNRANDTQSNSVPKANNVNYNAIKIEH